MKIDSAGDFARLIPGQLNFTFAVLQIIMESIQFIENNSELGAGTRGASLGVAAMKMAAINFQEDLFCRLPIQTVSTENQLLCEPNRTTNARYINGIVNVHESVSQIVQSVLNSGAFPLVLAGDHSSAAATIAGIRMAHPNDRLGVVWIDAHADLHTPYTTPSGNVHGMPLSMALAYDNEEVAVNQINEEEKGYWETLKKIGGIVPKIEPNDLVFIGVRDTEEQEEHLMHKHNIPNFSVAETQSKGAKAIVDQTMDKLNHCDRIYISFDVDSMDPSVSSGTGTPVSGGFDEKMAEELIHLFMARSKVCCLEVVEVNPLLDDKKNRMAEVAFQVVKSAVKTLEKR